MVPEDACKGPVDVIMFVCICFISCISFIPFVGRNKFLIMALHTNIYIYICIYINRLVRTYTRVSCS